MKYTAQLTDPSLSYAEGTDVRHFDGKADVLAAWYAGYWNTARCSDTWGGDLPAMSDQFTVVVWKGVLEDVTDCYPDAEVVLGRNGGPVWRPIA